MLEGRKISCHKKDTSSIRTSVNRHPRGMLSASRPGEQYFLDVRSINVTGGHYSILALAFACNWNNVQDLPSQKGNYRSDIPIWGKQHSRKRRKTFWRKRAQKQRNSSRMTFWRKISKI